MKRTKAVAISLAAFGLILMTGIASAQVTNASGIAGAVKDSSGAVLPGVTVEAASPALIEKVRTVVTDGDGQYKIVGLPSGAYTISENTRYGTAWQTPTAVLDARLFKLGVQVSF